ncbi:universal stress protein [Mucilaginibacter sp. AK015]|uniref:universal stress protein n=1 Tax=Mucilaginibacter sp. AK015 TaxID=2723072 RepID=UPI00160E2223|nr:universal stress protein [Mucilaginibacter sp. AK015]MBB5396854.1 nucleotide-binding universal stress UspA family protein [Mucilaginibacter sp. AK015]
MKKIIAAFDGLKFSKGTLDYAIELAVRGKSVVTGVFLEDFLYHSFNLFDMVGSEGISKTKLNHLLKKDQETRQAAVALFEQTCKKRGIEYLLHQDKRFAIDDLLKESIYADLTIIGAAETLNHFEQAKPTPFVLQLLAGTQSPVLVVPATHQLIERVIILYDGHPSSVYALKMFTYLFPWTVKYPSEIVYVSDKELDLLPDGNLIGEYTRSHFSKPLLTQLTGQPDETLVAHLRKAEPGTVVIMGAYSRGALSRMFNSSMANVLMEALDLPLFIAHH